MDTPRRRLRTLILPFAVAGALVSAPRPADATACPRFDPARVEVHARLAPLGHNTARTVAQLSGMPERKPGPAGMAGGQVLGLALAKYGQESRIQAVFQPQRDGTVCGAPARLSVTFGFQERRVYVARELPAGTCIHREVLAHEMKHVAVDEDLLRRFMPRIEARLRAVMTGIRPVRGRSQDEVMAAIRRPVDRALKILMDDFTRERDRRQAALDTVEEYRRVTRSCNGELSRYLKPSGARM